LHRSLSRESTSKQFCTRPARRSSAGLDLDVVANGTGAGSTQWFIGRHKLPVDDKELPRHIGTVNLEGPYGIATWTYPDFHGRPDGHVPARRLQDIDRPSKVAVAYTASLASVGEIRHRIDRSCESVAMMRSVPWDASLRRATSIAGHGLCNSRRWRPHRSRPSTSTRGNNKVAKAPGTEGSLAGVLSVNAVCLPAETSENDDHRRPLFALTIVLMCFLAVSAYH
jgi:hypothetical protein